VWHPIYRVLSGSLAWLARYFRMQDQMSDLTSEIEKRVRDGYEDVDHLVGVLAKSVQSSDRNLRLAAGVALASVAALGLGVVVYRRRRRRTLTSRLHDALSRSMKDVPEELATQLKRPVHLARSLSR
jgi:hypothetical protein